MAELRPLYKKLLRLAKNLPQSKRQSSIDQIRREFRCHEDLTDPKEVSELLQRAQSSISYLKIITPRDETSMYFAFCEFSFPFVKNLMPTHTDTGVQRFIYRNGQRVNATEFKEKGDEKARWKTQDVEAGYKRHHQLLRRQHFMDRKSGPPLPVF